jgi:hypothetical protein
VIISLDVELRVTCTIPICFDHGATAPSGSGRPHYRGFTITLRYSTLCRNPPLAEWLGRRRDTYLTTHNTNKRETSIPQTAFDPAILARERPQIHALDREATGNSFEYYDEIRRKRDGEGWTVRKYGKEEK